MNLQIVFRRVMADDFEIEAMLEAPFRKVSFTLKRHAGLAVGRNIC